MSDKLIHLKWVLVDQIADLTIATAAIRNHTSCSEFDPMSQYTTTYFRMCSTSLIITLSKLFEALRHYGKEINSFPEPIRSNLISLRCDIENKKIFKFRSKYAAHVIDDDTKTPISLAEGERRYKDIVGETIGDLLDFCDWICPADYQEKPECVISVVTKTRDHCLSVVGSCTHRP